MPILDLQRRIREVGRIRLGAKKVSQKSGKQYPAKLEQFRLTSTDHDAIAHAAELYGGKPQVWKDAPGHGTQYEVYTETDSMPVLMPPVTEHLRIEQLMSQWYEKWSGGGCLHRCDTQWDHLLGADCVCTPEMRAERHKDACVPTTRVKVILRELRGFGTWRLETHSWNAALELAASVELLAVAATRGFALPARLRLEPRSTVKDGQTSHFNVPVIDVDVTLDELGRVGVGPALEAGDRPPAQVVEIDTRRAALPAVEATRGSEPPANGQLPGEQVFLDAMPAPADQVAAQSAGTDTLQEKPPPRAKELPDPEAPFTDDDEPIAAPTIAAPTGGPPSLTARILEHARAAAGMDEEQLTALADVMWGSTSLAHLDAAQIGNLRFALDCINSGRMTFEWHAGYPGGTMWAGAEGEEQELLVYLPTSGEWVTEDTAEDSSAATPAPPGAAEPAPPPQPASPEPAGGGAPTDPDEWRTLARTKGIRVSAIIRRAKELVSGPAPGSYQQLAELDGDDRDKVWAWLSSQG